jgi:ADP-heptose:LPS heptosyltransferase
MNPKLSAGIERIAVFRALVLGDLLCAVPALRALRRGFPDAEITLVGLPWAEALVQRLPMIDDFIAFPGHPELPEIDCEVRAVPRFLDQVQARRFDLALQLHGSGRVVNALVALFGARHVAGFFDEHAWRPAQDAELFVPWPEHGHEIERLLALTDGLGLARDGVQLEFPLVAADRVELLRLWPQARGAGPYVCVHAGAQLPSRRWPVERFAAVADAIAASGRTVVLTGAASEAPLAAAVQASMTQPSVNLAGRTSLWTLGALLEGAEQLVSNDTGVSHIAAALKCPSVIVSSGADVARWAPLDHALHRVLWAPMPCRPCGHRVCPIGHPCALAVEPEHVLQEFHRRAARSRDLELERI